MDIHSMEGKRRHTGEKSVTVKYHWNKKLVLLFIQALIKLEEKRKKKKKKKKTKKKKKNAAGVIVQQVSPGLNIHSV